uniref:BACK domain-containing protein n=1 Tax=Periophthalmus magnuspinnatus TaxID=409849 RepID=A0A3B4AL41_9GOBI
MGWPGNALASHRRSWRKCLGCGKFGSPCLDWSQELSGFIEDDELDVKNETVVYQAVLHWTNHDLQQRRVDFPHVLAKVRFDQISLEFLNNNVLSNPLVKDHLHTREVQAIYALSNSAGSHIRLIRPRLPGAILLAIGGWSGGDPTNGIEAYDYKADRWVNVTNHQERARAYHGSVFLVYCVGGFDGTEHFNSVRRLDLATRTWHEMPPMYHRRCYVSVAVLNRCIYAMGGHNGHIRLSTAEVFDPETNLWSPIRPMNEQRSDANCVAVNGEIYICGGFNDIECLQTAECYDPRTKQWSLIAPMTTRRSGVAVIAYGDYIYAVGGFDGNMRLNSVEAYSPRTNSWRPVASMLTTCSNFGIEVAYDPLVDSWSVVCDMDIFRSALNCCVISGLPNMTGYAISRNALPLLDIEMDESDEEAI